MKVMTQSVWLVGVLGGDNRGSQPLDVAVDRKVGLSTRNRSLVIYADLCHSFQQSETTVIVRMGDMGVGYIKGVVQLKNPVVGVSVQHVIVVSIFIKLLHCSLRDCSLDVEPARVTSDSTFALSCNFTALVRMRLSSYFFKEGTTSTHTNVGTGVSPKFLW
jgi:hypothetical protein